MSALSLNDIMPITKNTKALIEGIALVRALEGES